MLNFDKIISLEETISTNLYARELYNDNLNCNYIVRAKFQTGGKGLASNVWESEFGKNLLFSCCLNLFDIKAANQFVISKVLSVTILKLISQFVDNVSIKWPNDIYVGNKKITGILIENYILKDKVSRTICGIGINVNQKSFSKNIPNPTSLVNLCNHSFDLDLLFNKFVDTLGAVYSSIKSGEIDINKEYQNHLYIYGQWAKFTNLKTNEAFKGRITGVNNFGQLEIENEDLDKEYFGFKEIRYNL